MRDERIDYLRFIGLTMIIFAHVGPPGILFQLRNFDVPLMVLVSGMSFVLSFKNSESYLSYIWKRIKRLLFPVWIFLTVYFLFIFFLDSSSSDLNLKSIVDSYFLLGGIGFVWIIRVFILVAFVSPLLFNFHQRESDNFKYLFKILLLLLGYEFIRYFSIPYLDSSLLNMISSYTHYIVPYSLIFALGLRIPSLKIKSVIILSAISLCVFLTMVVLFHFFSGVLFII